MNIYTFIQNKFSFWGVQRYNHRNSKTKHFIFFISAFSCKMETAAFCRYKMSMKKSEHINYFNRNVILLKQ